jgi:hypothetical protein
MQIPPFRSVDLSTWRVQEGLRCLKLLSVSGAFAVGAAGALALATSLLLRSVLPTRGIFASLLSIWLLFFGQIVLISEILSELHALGSTGLLAGHVLLFGAALIVFVRAGRKRLAPWPDGAREALRAFLRESPGIALFAEPSGPGPGRVAEEEIAAAIGTGRPPC